MTPTAQQQLPALCPQQLRAVPDVHALRPLRMCPHLKWGKQGTWDSAPDREMPANHLEASWGRSRGSDRLRLKTPLGSQMVQENKLQEA